MQQTLDLRALAEELKAAQDDVKQIEPFTSRLSGFNLCGLRGCAFDP
jgi:hypothetical protein